MATDRPLLGTLFLLITGIVAIASLIAFLFVEPVEIVAWLADPDVLLGVVLFNLLFAVIRLFATEYAWLAGGGKRWFVAVLLGVLVAIPHAAVAWVGLETRESLTAIFDVSPQPIAGPASTTTTSGSTTSSTTTTTTVTTTTSIELSPIVTAPDRYWQDEVDAIRAAPPQPLGTERLNILLLGGDAGPGRRGLRTDALIVASIDPISGDAALIGVPRNYGNPTLTDGTPVPVTQLGHVYGWGMQNPGRFDGADPGAGAVRSAVENLTGLEIDHYLLVDLTGFADVVDAFGGVEINVSEPMDAPLYDEATGLHEMVHIPVGVHHFHGADALAYSRVRYGSSDYVRMGRQRCLLAALANQSDMLSLLTRLDGILEAVEANMTTDLPIDLVPDLILLTPRVSPADIRLIGFDNTWGVGRTPRGRTIPDVARIREAVRITIEDPASAGDFSLTTAGEGC